LHAGRVNLIGEHIDYEGYSVLPMAIRQDTIVAIRRQDEGEAEKVLRIANVNDKYTVCIYPADPEQVCVTKKNAPKVCYNVTFLKKIFAPTIIGMQQGYNKFNCCFEFRK
jgi:galactokinase